MKIPIAETLAIQLELNGLPPAEREHRFHTERKWRFDFAWPTLRIAVECEGGVWTGGRHTRGLGYINDLEKYNTAALAGWLVLRFTPVRIRHGEAITALQTAIARNTKVLKVADVRA